VPLHLEPAFADLGCIPGDFPVAERVTGSIMSLPMFPYLSSDEVRHVARSIREVCHD
jgi:UDP-2-acetamido-2-deoxy-ribo-hexuluronate aminotransferase